MLRLLAFPVLLIVSISPSIHSYDPKHDFLVSDEVNQQTNVVPKQDYVDLAKKYGLDPRKIVCYPSPDDDGSCIMTYIGKVTHAYPISMMYHPGKRPIRPLSPESSPESESDSERARFYLHTKKTQNLEKPIELFVDADEGDNGKAKEFFNPDGPVKILAHGYHSNINKDFPKLMMQDYIEFVPDVNVILVDWEKQAGNPDLKAFALLMDYNDASGNTEFVGKRAATLVKRLVAEKFTSPDKIHFIGHSLGSHVGGFTGFYLKPDKMGRISGLDPAAPGFCLMQDQTRRLTSEDAEFVDIIHSDGGDLCNIDTSFTRTVEAIVGYQKVGLFEHLGHADFYPNGGSGQPGCDINNGACSHSRSHQLMRATVNPANTFAGRRSTGWLAFLNDEGPLNETALMGERCTNKARGMYYLKTGGEFPYLLNES